MGGDGEETLPITKSVTGRPEREPDENWWQEEQDQAKQLNDHELFIFDER